ncbi:MAG: hypothetical protein V4529_04730 [Gemmatimonadota bacterium]
MTSHLTDASLAAMLERDDSVADDVRLHLAECDQCRAALTAARTQIIEVNRLLELLTVTQPEIDPVEFVRQVASGTGLTREHARTRRLRSRRFAHNAIAAAILLSSVAAAALVTPATMRRLLHVAAVASRITSDQPSAAPGKSDRSQPLPRGVEISPHGRVDVLFRSSQLAGSVRVVSASIAELSVTGTDAGPTYTVGSNSIIVTNHPSDSLSFVVGVPALSDTDTVYIHVAGQIVYSNIGNRVIAPLSADQSGQIVLPFQNLRR